MIENNAATAQKIWGDFFPKMYRQLADHDLVIYRGAVKMAFLFKVKTFISFLFGLH